MGPARWHLAGGLALAALLWLAPESAVDRLRGAALDLLRPGQQCAEQGMAWGRDLKGMARVRADSGVRLAELERELELLTQENEALRGQCAASQALQASPFSASGESGDDPLLVCRLVPARLLGRQAQAYLSAHDLLDVGTATGAAARALVVDAPLIDQGAGAQLAVGDYVLAGQRVWGRVASAGRHTSSLRRVSDAGYRDLVMIAHRDGDQLHPGPQGLWEGTGEPECRIRLVEATSPVAVGDLVYTADSEGLLPAPLLYGEVISAELPPAARHWEIRVRPATGALRTGRVAVVRTEVNERRVAEQPRPEERVAPPPGEAP